jgi:hypothetical protein
VYPTTLKDEFIRKYGKIGIKDNENVSPTQLAEAGRATFLVSAGGNRESFHRGKRIGAWGVLGHKVSNCPKIASRIDSKASLL